MFHNEDFEILLPEKIQKENKNPLLLTLGPTVTMVFPILVMALVNSRVSYNKSSSYFLVSLSTGITSALLGIIWGVANHIYRTDRYRKSLTQKKTEFLGYLQRTEDYLSLCATENREYMETQYPKLNTVLNSHSLKNSERDELFIRLGIGNVPFQMNVYVSEGQNRMSPTEEYLTACELKERMSILRNVPIGIGLDNGKPAAFVVSRENPLMCEYVLSLIFYLAFTTDSNRVKMCLFYDEADDIFEKVFENVKFLPHFWVKDDTLRLVSSNEHTKSEIIPFLSEELQNEKKDVRYVVFLSKEELLKNETIFDALFIKTPQSFTGVVFSEDEKSIPYYCRKKCFFPDEGAILGKIVSENAEETFFESEDTDLKLSEEGFLYAASLSNATDKDSSLNMPIPSEYSFLKMYGVTRPEEIDIARMYRENHCYERIKVPIGCAQNGEVVCLDVCEKFHGPHGLVAGTTGSGKSELLQTYIMSLCLSYSPGEVNFFLIDYKGGGTGNYIDKLPHCVGSVSNLSGNAVNRAITAIRAENLRRQEILKKYGVNHIDDYLKKRKSEGYSEEMPHLLLIIDEFAELKKEEPDFMQQIISLAAVGRSLGMHLILATQKPAGIIDDKISANSRFRLCLKVQDKNDSMDVLGRKDAAFLVNPGRCYLKIGNDEYYTCFQGAYLGERICKEKAKEGDVALVEKQGRRIKATALQNHDGESEKLLSVLTDFVCRMSEKEGYERPSKLWMDELSIAYESPDTSKKIPDYIPLGIYDDPSKQQQKEFGYIPQSDSNFGVVGAPNFGKSNVLKLIMNSNYPMEYVLIDLTGNLKAFAEYSNCIGYLFKADKKAVFLHHLQKNLIKREHPLLVLIDNIASFIAVLSDTEIDEFTAMLGKGPGLNIYFVMTGGALSDFGGRIFAKIKTVMALNMNDKYAYGDVLREYRFGVSLKKDTKGRALFRIGDSIKECQLYLAGIRNENSVNASQHFPAVPDNPSFKSMVDEYAHSSYFDERVLPVGYSQRTGYIRGIRVDIPGLFVICGATGVRKKELSEHINMTLVSYFGKYADKVQIFENLDESIWNGRKADELVIAFLDENTDSSLLLDTNFRKEIAKNRGIVLGGNLSTNRFLSFDDMSYSQLNGMYESNIGHMRLFEKSRTVKLLIPEGKRKEENDDYD